MLCGLIHHFKFDVFPRLRFRSRIIRPPVSSYFTKPTLKKLWFVWARKGETTNLLRGQDNLIRASRCTTICWWHHSHIATCQKLVTTTFIALQLQCFCARVWVRAWILKGDHSLSGWLLSSESRSVRSLTAVSVQTLLPYLPTHLWLTTNLSTSWVMTFLHSPRHHTFNCNMVAL